MQCGAFGMLRIEGLRCCVGAGVCCGWVHPQRTSCPRTLQVGCGSNGRLPSSELVLVQTAGSFQRLQQQLLTVWAGLQLAARCRDGRSPAEQPTTCCRRCQHARHAHSCPAVAPPLSPYPLPPSGRVLSGTLTLGQLRRGAGAAPACTPFSFTPLPAAPKKDEPKAAGSAKPKTAEQRVCMRSARPNGLLCEPGTATDATVLTSSELRAPLLESACQAKGSRRLADPGASSGVWDTPADCRLRQFPIPCPALSCCSCLTRCVTPS